MSIESFIDSLSTRTESKETLRAYGQTLTRFTGYLNDEGIQIDEVKPSTITEYLRHLEDNTGRPASGRLAPSTVSRHLSVISAYYEFRRDESDTDVRNPVEKVRRPKVRNEKPRDVNDNELAKLVDGISDVRDRAIVLLFVYSGMRLDELYKTDKTTITLTKKKQPDGSSLYFGSGEVVGKGNKRRTFLVGPKAMQAVATYLAQKRMKDDLAPLFLSSRGTRLSSRAIQQIVSKW